MVRLMRKSVTLALITALLLALSARTPALAAGPISLVKDINIGTAPAPLSPGELVSINGVLYFPANDESSGYELWKSDGSAIGTVMIGDINPGAGGSSPSNLRAAGGTLYFTANNGSSGRELWKSNGSLAGTVLVKDINPGAAESAPFGLTVVGSTLFFIASDGSSGEELWKSDGSAAVPAGDSALGIRG
jgi:trimeric autotransporter adhesin